MSFPSLLLCLALLASTAAPAQVTHKTLRPSGGVAQRVPAIELWFPRNSAHPLPLLLFSPGLGNRVHDYSLQLQQVAEFGYVIAAVDHTPDHLPTLEQQALLWARDMAQAQRWLLQSGAAPRIDPARIGAFGHSLGGRAAADLCQIDPHVRACLNQDGQADDVRLQRPYWPLPGRPFAGAFAFLDWFDPGLTAEDYRRMQTTPDAYALTRLRPEGRALDVYRAPQGGSYRITLLVPGMQHTAFSDLPSRRANSNAERERWQTLLWLISRLTSDFFEETLTSPRRKLPCGVVREQTLIQCFRTDSNRQ